MTVAGFILKDPLKNSLLSIAVANWEKTRPSIWQIDLIGDAREMLFFQAFEIVVALLMAIMIMLMPPDMIKFCTVAMSVVAVFGLAAYAFLRYKKKELYKFLKVAKTIKSLLGHDPFERHGWAFTSIYEVVDSHFDAQILELLREQKANAEHDIYTRGKKIGAERKRLKREFGEVQRFLDRPETFVERIERMQKSAG